MNPSRPPGALLALAPTLLAVSAGAAQELVIWHGYRGEERAALGQVTAAIAGLQWPGAKAGKQQARTARKARIAR